MLRSHRGTSGRSRNARRVDFESLELRLLMSVDVAPYDIGAPNVVDIWVDPVHGNDANTGSVRSQAVSSLADAWSRVPAETTLTAHGYRILLVAGDYPAALLPANGWASDRHGTAQNPVMLAAADGSLTAHLHGPLDCQNDSYLYLIGLDFITDPGASGGGNVVQAASDDHVLIRNCRLNGSDGTTRLAQETLKVNQCQNVFVENSDISGAFWFALDFVAVQYGHVLGSHMHDTGDDGVVLKGGSAQITLEGNVIDNIGNIGFAAGQGTGFEFMVAPWIHYEAYDLKFINNIVHDTQNAGMAVRGGYDILLADNTLYRVGQNQGAGSSMLLFSPGGRSCDGDVAACQARHDLGGWGPTTAGAGGEWIPNKDVFVYDNIFDNPAGSATMWEDVGVFSPTTAPAGTNIPNPVLSDENLVIRGNIFWNGTADHPVGPIYASWGARISAANAAGTINPQLVNPADGDFAPLPGGNVFGYASLPIPEFPGNDRAQPPLAPQGVLSNVVSLDKNGRARDAGSAIGAVISEAVPPAPPVPQPPAAFATPPFFGDFDGDGIVDPGVFEPSTSTFYIARSHLGNTAIQFGIGTLYGGNPIPVPNAYAGGGVTVPAVYEPSTSTFYIAGPHGNSALQFGIGTLYGGHPLVVSGDYEGDGIVDPAVFEPSSSTFYIARHNAPNEAVQFGIGTLYGGHPIPVADKYEGAGITDPAVYEPSTSTFYIARHAAPNEAIPFGMGTLYGGHPVVVPGNYEGDGTIDPAVYEPSTSTFFIARHAAPNAALQFGIGTLYGGHPIVVSGTYEGDVVLDPAVYEPTTSTFSIARHAAPNTALQFGIGSLYGGHPVVVAANFGGGGFTDPAVFEPTTSTFYIARHGAPNMALQFGIGTLFGGNPIPISSEISLRTYQLERGAADLAVQGRVSTDSVGNSPSQDAANIARSSVSAVVRSIVVQDHTPSHVSGWWRVARRAFGPRIRRVVRDK